MAGLVNKMVIGGHIHAKDEATLTADAISQADAAADVAATYTEAEIQAIADLANANKAGANALVAKFNALLVILTENGVLDPA